MKEQSVYVYITNKKIQALVGKCVKSKLVMEHTYEKELEEGSILNGVIMNDFSLKATIKEMWEEFHIPDKNVTLIVGGNSITVRMMEIPQTTAKNMPGLIRSELRDMDDIQNLMIDYSVLEPKKENGSCGILAAIFRKEFIIGYIELFREAKIELAAIDVAQNALIKFTKNLSTLMGRTYAIFILDGNMLTQYLFCNNFFKMVRRSRILSDPEDDGFEREIGQNINSIIQFNKSEQTGFDVTDIYLCGFPSETEYLFENFSRNFGIQVRSFPEFQPNEIEMRTENNPAEWVVLLGGMIRYSE